MKRSHRHDSTVEHANAIVRLRGEHVECVRRGPKHAQIGARHVADQGGDYAEWAKLSAVVAVNGALSYRCW